jgi:ribosome biogenesis protein MAK21
MLRRHFHPSVQAFAVSWQTAPSHTISFSGDPITEFSITAFLNRFSYKNPKKRNMDKVHRPMPKPEDPINSALFTEMSAEEIAPEKVFFHKFFGTRVRMMNEGKIKNRSRKRDEDNDEEERVSDVDIDEAEIDEFADTLADNLMKSTAGNIPDFDDDEDMDADIDSDDVPEGVIDDNDADNGIEGDSEDEEDRMDVEFDEFSSDDDDVIGKKKGKKNKRNSKDEDVFASAVDYEEEMEENLKSAREVDVDSRSDSRNKKARRR